MLPMELILIAKSLGLRESLSRINSMVTYSLGGIITHLIEVEWSKEKVEFGFVPSKNKQRQQTMPSNSR